jgi:hypothetical protein
VDEPSVFDKLVARLSTEERREMLSRIEKSFKVIDLPEEISEPPETVDLDESYRVMGFFRRLIVIIIAFLTGRDRLAVVETQLLRDVRRRVAATMPHGFDTAHDQMRPKSVEDFRELARCARHFTGILGRVMGRERSSFVAFLVGLHAPTTQQRLIEETDPFVIGEVYPDSSEHEVKRRSVSALEGILTELQSTTRQKIYSDLRVLHHMMALSSFQYDRFIAAFLPVTGGEAVPVPISRVSQELTRLASIFSGLRVGPSARLLEALSLFEHQDQLDTIGDEIEGVVQADLEAASEAYAGIHSFGRRYPLVQLVRIATNTVHFKATPLSGGEDWFIQWKNFWMERVDSANRRFAYDRQIQQMRQDTAASLGLASLEPFPGYPPSGLDDPAKHGMAMGLLRSVFVDLYSNEMERPLGALFKEGEFYKSDNRSELDAAMEALERLRTDVANLEIRLRPSGDLGAAWQNATGENNNGVDHSEDQIVVARSVDSEAAGLLQRGIEVFRKLGNILQGVLFGSIGGQYDTISNLGEIGGRDPQAYIRDLEKVHVRCKSIERLVSEMHASEAFQGR